MSFLSKSSAGLSLCALLFLATTARTDSDSTQGWKRSLAVDITTTQTSYSDSWVGGEFSSVNWVSNLKGSAEKGLRQWFNFKTTLKLAFGQTLTQYADSAGNSRNWSKPRKSTDLIDWENVGRFTLNRFVDPYLAFRIETQFLDASNEARKMYFTPVKLTESAGISRKFYQKDANFITSRLGLGLRQIFKKTVDSSLTVLDSTLIDGGIESVTDVEFNLNSKLSYVGKLTLFKAVYFSEKSEVKGTPYEDDWKAIDVNWENMIGVSVTRIIAVNLYAQLLYDKEISRKGRFKETLAIGFVFKML